MKKLLITLLVLAGIQGIAKADDTTIPYDQLPREAKNFIEQNFSVAQVKYATKDFNEFAVRLKDGTHIEFNAKGGWKEIEGHDVSAKFLPQTAQNFLNEKYNGEKITQIEKKSMRYEIELASGIDISFDMAGRVTRIEPEK